jgi:hypothetical protein
VGLLSQAADRNPSLPPPINSHRGSARKKRLYLIFHTSRPLFLLHTTYLLPGLIIQNVRQRGTDVCIFPWLQLILSRVTRYLAKLTNCFSFIAIKPDGVQVWSIRTELNIEYDLSN